MNNWLPGRGLDPQTWRARLGSGAEPHQLRGPQRRTGGRLS